MRIKPIHCATTFAISLLALFATKANATNACEPPCRLAVTPGLYFSVFGGGGSNVNTKVFQYGTVITAPLGVNATGSLNSNSLWLTGANLGYAYKNPCWFIIPGLEFEGYYLRNKLKGSLFNPSTVLPNHFFNDSFTVNTEVFLINAIFSFNIPCNYPIRPYAGIGIGGAVLSANGTSIQTNPPEAVNHFNSRNHSSDSTFAGQAKLGLKWMFTPNWSVFAEYRFLYLGSNHYNFGSTVAPTHAVTSAWGVNFDSLRYNLGTAGIQFSV